MTRKAAVWRALNEIGLCIGPARKLTIAPNYKDRKFRATVAYYRRFFRGSDAYRRHKAQGIIWS